MDEKPRPIKRNDRISTRLSRPSIKNQLHLNIVPISFSSDQFTLGRIPYENEEQYENLRHDHQRTHVFRFDRRDSMLVNVSLYSDIEPLGKVSQAEDVEDHLHLLGKTFQHSILEWIKEKRTILKRNRPLVFWGNQQGAKLLSQAIASFNLTPHPKLEVHARYSFDTRVFQVPNESEKYYLALVIELSTSNAIDVPLSNLVEAGIDLTGTYVVRRPITENDNFRPRSELLGSIANIDNGKALLNDCLGANEISIEDAFLEPRQENLEAVVRGLYLDKAGDILDKLQTLRTDYLLANKKLQLIQQTLIGLKSSHAVSLHGGLNMHLTELLTSDSPLFPRRIEVSRPDLLFGPKGRNTSSYPDSAIQDWGPFKYMFNERNSPLIVVLCEAQYRGRVEQFMQSVRDGFPDESWNAATSWQTRKQKNPYQGGLIGKYRLSQAAIEYEEILGADVQSYRKAASRLLGRLSKTPDLAIVQIRQSFRALHGEQNPYFVSKAVFMQAGIPVQAVQKEKICSSDYQLPWILNSISLACYAKMGGIPWVISTRRPTSHELVIGMGYTEVGDSRLGDRERYVGITTLFQGDGRYQVWGLTREVEFENYADALLENLHTTINHVKEKNNWQSGDSVRLIFHVYKPLKHKEMDAIKELVSKLIENQYSVSYAFLDISQYHPNQLFDPRQTGTKAKSSQKYKGVGVPDRGIALFLDQRTALLHLTGPGDLKTDYQGLPRPLKIELHEDSDFDDLTYLVRQIYHFTYMSWRSFSPSTEPITIAYSRLISRALGNLKMVSGWNSSVLTVGTLRDSMWFL